MFDRVRPFYEVYTSIIFGYFCENNTVFICKFFYFIKVINAKFECKNFNQLIFNRKTKNCQYSVKACTVYNVHII